MKRIALLYTVCLVAVGALAACGGAERVYDCTTQSCGSAGAAGSGGTSGGAGGSGTDASQSDASSQPDGARDASGDISQEAANDARDAAQDVGSEAPPCIEGAASNNIDPANCGGCGKRCSNNNIATPTCAGGTCNGACNAGFADCDNNKLSNGCESSNNIDPANCGGCGKACSGNNIATPTCAGGACNGTCNAGFADCDNNKLTNGCESASNGDPANCGSCGRTCSNNNIAAPTCANGACDGACNAGFADCDNNKLTNGCESSSNGDPANCGGCGRTCSNNNIAAPTCAGAACNGACNPGFADCDNNKFSNGCEINTTLDPNNCAQCGRTCPNTVNVATTRCAASACAVASCLTGFANCNGQYADGCEANLKTDRNNCNGCGVVCPSTQACRNGVCSNNVLGTQNLAGHTEWPLDPQVCGCCGAVTTKATADALCVLGGFISAITWVSGSITGSNCYCWNCTMPNAWADNCCSGLGARPMITQVTCQ
jgi:hypothetical protein